MTAPPTPTMRVALVVDQLWQPVPGGSGTYVRELARGLLDRPDVRPVGISARHGGPPAEAWAPPADLPIVQSGLPTRVLYEAWNQLRRPRTARRAGPADVVHATTWAVPPAASPLVVTVHDLAFLRAPEHFTARGNSFFRRALEITRAEAAAVITVSSTTRDDCVRAGIAPDRLHVVHHGVRTPTITEEEVEEFRRAHSLDRPYVLWCGTVEPRKNLPGLLRAFERVVAAGADLDLVIVGPAGWGDAAAETARVVDRLPAGRVHLLGHRSLRELHTAYAGARLFCFPSHWEGFGLPVLEAMSHGVPVVTSRGTSMAEVVGDAGVLVDPDDVADIADGILAADGARHDELAALARAAAAGFTWDACAAATLEVYRSIL